MKKLLVLLVVLGLVSSANAGVIDIVITSLDGVAINPVHEITITPSQTVDLQLVWTGPTNLYLFSLTTFINKSGPGAGTLDLTQRVRNSNYDAALGKIGTSGGQQWIVEAASFYGAPGTNAPVTIVSNILLHCDGEGDVILTLSNYAAGGGSMEVNESFDVFTPGLGNGVIIHQVPEPMTLMLLGLGSLFLVKRKK